MGYEIGHSQLGTYGPCLLFTISLIKRLKRALMEYLIVNWPSVRQDGCTLTTFYFSFLASLSHRHGFQFHQPAEKEQNQHPAILTDKAWTVQDSLQDFRESFSWWTQRVLPSGQDSAIELSRVANQLSHLVYSRSKPYNMTSLVEAG